MTNQEILNLNQVIGTMGSLSGVKFAYAISKNKNLLDIEIKSIIETKKEADKNTPRYDEFNKKRIELCEKYSVKDTNGKSIMKNIIKDANGNIVYSDYTFGDNEDKFNKEAEILKVPYKKDIDEKENKIKKFNEFLLEKSDFKPFKIKLDDVPKEITVAQMQSITSLIEE